MRFAAMAWGDMRAFPCLELGLEARPPSRGADTRPALPARAPAAAHTPSPRSAGSERRRGGFPRRRPRRVGGKSAEPFGCARRRPCAPLDRTRTTRGVKMAQRSPLTIHTLPPRKNAHLKPRLAGKAKRLRQPLSRYGRRPLEQRRRRRGRPRRCPAA